MFGGEAHVGVGVQDLDRWQQGSQAGCETLPAHAMELAATSKRLYPALQHIAAKRSHPLEIARNGVILEIPLHHLLQPLHGSWYPLVHPLTQLRPNILELGCHAFGDRFPADRESACLVVRPTNGGMSMAPFVDRPRRYPKLASSNTGSKIGSSRLSSACCHTLS